MKHANKMSSKKKVNIVGVVLPKFGSYSYWLQAECEFHGTHPKFDCKTYFDNLPFKFVLKDHKIAESQVFLPPWQKPPKQLRSILNNIGCSTTTTRVPKVECKGAQPLRCLLNAKRMVELNGGGSVVFGYSIFQGTKHWHLERHAVYKTVRGKLVDPTPPVFTAKQEPYNCFIEELNVCLSKENTMSRTHIIWMNKAQLKWMFKNGWYGNIIFMESLSKPAPKSRNNDLVDYCLECQSDDPSIMNVENWKIVPIHLKIKGKFYKHLLS
jgi:hypothetical protein